MLRWGEFEREAPVLAAGGRELLYQVGSVGLGFLGTVRRDGGPRLHPVCPVLCEGGLYLFLIPSPKRTDLLRDPRYALHSYPADDNEDAFYVAGEASVQAEPAVRDLLAAAWFRERQLSSPPPGFDDELLFELRIDTALLTRTTGHGDYQPQHQVWKHAADG
jgi:hypothetical protein